MPHFPPKSYNIQACENTEYFKTQDEQTKGEQENLKWGLMEWCTLALHHLFSCNEFYVQPPHSSDSEMICRPRSKWFTWQRKVKLVSGTETNVAIWKEHAPLSLSAV